MKARLIGSTNVSVTELGFGGAPIGNLFDAVSDDQALGAIESAWHQGIRYFDTAPHYGLGLSERRLGAALSGRSRREFVVSTKVGRLLRPNPRPKGSDLGNGFAVPDDLIRVFDYSRDGIRRSVEESLQRLDMNYLDIVLVHDAENHVDQVIRESFPALEELREEEVIRAIGAGMNYWEPLRQFVETGDLDVVMLAGRWNLLDRTGEPLLDACFRRGVSVISAGPFASGILSRSAPVATDHFEYREVPGSILARAQELAATCKEFDVGLPQAAIQFPFRHPAVDAVVVGIRNSEEALINTRLADTTVPEAMWREFDHQDRK